MYKSIGKSESAKSKTISVRIDPTELNGLLIEKPWKKLGLPVYTNVHTTLLIYCLLYIQEPAAKYGSVKILKDICHVQPSATM